MHARPGWMLLRRGPWTVASPSGHEPREQGWKLYLSATAANATTVLDRAGPVLVDRRCAFEVAAPLDTVRLLGGPSADRSSAGRFLTAYPRDDDHFRFR